MSPLKKRARWNDKELESLSLAVHVDINSEGRSLKDGERLKLKDFQRIVKKFEPIHGREVSTAVKQETMMLRFMKKSKHLL